MTPPFCCEAVPGTCVPAPPAILTTDPRRVAFVTLLMMGDGYLPGVVLLGLRLRELAPQHPRVCMVTPDVSEAARKAIAAVYDRVVPVEYIRIPQEGYKNKVIAPAYSRTFTKLRALLLTEYERVVMMDADMVPMRRLAELAQTPAPAGVWVGGRPNHYGSKDKFDLYRTQVCSLAHGKRVPGKWYDLARRTTKSMAVLYVETAIAVLPTSEEYFRQAVEMLRRSRHPQKEFIADTGLLGKLFIGRWNALDIRYLARWTDDETNGFVLDMYGQVGKPWDASKADELREYRDVRMWWRAYAKEMAGRPELRRAHPALEAAYHLARGQTQT